VILAWLTDGGAVVTGETYTASAPGGAIGSPITITLLPSGDEWPGSGTISVNDGGAGGTFSDDTLELSGGSDPITFTYTPATLPVTLSFTNDAGLDDPSDLTLGFALSPLRPGMMMSRGRR
jgi:hypothetical protein